MTAPYPHFDLDELAAWEGDIGRGTAAQLVDMLRTSGPQSIESLRAALLARDGETAHREAHSLKSLARMVGARRLGLLAESVERATAAASWQMADTLFEPMPPECEAVIAFLTARYKPD